MRPPQPGTLFPLPPLHPEEAPAVHAEVLQSSSVSPEIRVAVLQHVVLVLPLLHMSLATFASVLVHLLLISLASIGIAVLESPCLAASPPLVASSTSFSPQH